MTQELQKDRREIFRWLVFGSLLLAIAYRWFQQTLLHQLEAPVLIFPEADNTYWLLHLINLPQWLVGNFWIALVFDLLWISTALLSLVYHRARIWPFLTTVLTLLYFVTFHSYFGHHGHSLIGFLFITIPFWFYDKRTFKLLWKGLRYYACFVYASAGWYKVIRGSAFQLDQLYQVMKVQNVDLLHDGAQGFQETVMAAAIGSPGLLSFLGIAVTVVQVGFTLGFFTRKLDLFLLLGALFFHLGTWLLMDIVFWELWIIWLAFFPVSKKPPPQEKINAARRPAVEASKL